MASKQLRIFIDDVHRSQDRERIVSEDLEPNRGILSRLWEIRRYLGNMGLVVKELCYGKAETLGDAEEAARWWRYYLVR